MRQRHLTTDIFIMDTGLGDVGRPLTEGFRPRLTKLFALGMI